MLSLSFAGKGQFSTWTCPRVHHHPHEYTEGPVLLYLVICAQPLCLNLLLLLTVSVVTDLTPFINVFEVIT